MEKQNLPCIKYLLVQCKFCKKQFRYNFGLKKHISKYHSNLDKCSSRRKMIRKNSAFYKHMRTRDNDLIKKIYSRLKLKLYKSGGVWKSKLNCVFKCKICFENFDLSSNLAKHMKIHEDDILMYCEYCSLFIPVDESKNHPPENHDKIYFECEECNIRFYQKETFNFHLSHCTKRFSSSKNENGLGSNLIKRNGVRSAANSIASTGQTVSQTLIENDCTIIESHKNSSCKNVAERYNSDQMDIDPENNISSIEQTKSQTLIENDFGINESYKNNPCRNVAESCSSDQMDIDPENCSSFIEQTESQTLIENDCRMNESHKNSPCKNIAESYNSDQMEIDQENSISSNEQTISQTSIENDCRINESHTNSTCTNITESYGSDQMDIDPENSNGSIVQSVSRDDLTVNDCGVYVEKEKDFCTNTTVKSNLNQKVSRDENLNNIVDDILKNRKLSNKRFARSVILISHMTTRSKCILYKCKCCNKQFNRQVSYVYHMQSHNLMKNKNVENVNSKKQKKINDNNKNKTFNSSVSDREKTQFWFPCDRCTKKYSTPLKLVMHRTSHCGIAPYTCKICNRSFALKDCWDRHLNSHYRRNKLKTKMCCSVQHQGQFECDSGKM